MNTPNVAHAKHKAVNDSFEIFWERIIWPTVQKANSEIDKEFRDACGIQFAYEDPNEYKRRLHKVYHEKREWLKKIYLPHISNPMLDMHKLGAILSRCMLACKPFRFDFSGAENYVLTRFSSDERNHIDWFVSNIYVNYKVAFYVGTGMAFANLVGNYRRGGTQTDVDAFEYFKNQRKLTYYPKSEHHDSYENSCIIALQKNDAAGRKFDYLGFAINLFQLEEYNKMHYLLNRKTAQ